MINLYNIVKELNNSLNAIVGGGKSYKYAIYSDLEMHHQPKRDGNTVKKEIEGIASIINSSIVPVAGLQLGTQTIAVELAIPIDTKEIQTEHNYQSIIQTYKNDIDTYVSAPQTKTLGDNVVSIVGTLAEVGEVETRQSIGLMIPITFTVTFNFFKNGINSANEELYYVAEGKEEKIHYTSMSITRVVVQDGGAFSNTGGIAKNYVQTTSLSIELTVAALTDNSFGKRFRDFLFTGNNTPFTLKHKNNSIEEENEYTMLFLTSNEQSQGIDNIGYSITLAEALEV